MRKYFLVVIIASQFCQATAQDLPLDEDDNQFSLSSGYTNTGLPIYISYELLVYENFSFGAEGSFRFFNEKTDTANYKHNLFGLIFFGNYYFNSLLKMDKKMGLYGGIHLGYYKWFSPDGYFDIGKSSSTLAAGAHIGYRYFFNDHFGAFIELTGDTQYFGGKIGVSYKFR